MGMHEVGFLGMGIMGRPMATRLAAAGTPLVVWNRTAARCEEVVAAGARRVTTADEVLESCRFVVLMLADEAAIDEVLGRGTPAFAERVAGRVLVHMGTTEVAYATGLDADVVAAGGVYVEAPVSGSKVPAERGELVVMAAGPPDALADVEELLRPLYRSFVRCGARAGDALTMKLAVNLYLVTTVAALAEAAHFASMSGLDLGTFTAVVDGGQLGSPIARVKGAKLKDRDFAPQAAIHDVQKNSDFVVRAARSAGVSTPMADLADTLYAETMALGYGDADMAAVVRAIEERTAAARRDRSGRDS